MGIEPFFDSDDFHIHGISDKKIDFTDWINQFNANSNDLYCEEIYSSLEKCLSYICKRIERTKSLLPKGTHIYKSNVKKIKVQNFYQIEELKETLSSLTVKNFSLYQLIKLVLPLKINNFSLEELKEIIKSIKTEDPSLKLEDFLLMIKDLSLKMRDSNTDKEIFDLDDEFTKFDKEFFNLGNESNKLDCTNVLTTNGLLTTKDPNTDKEVFNFNDGSNVFDCNNVLTTNGLSITNLPAWKITPTLGFLPPMSGLIPAVGLFPSVKDCKYYRFDLLTQEITPALGFLPPVSGLIPSADLFPSAKDRKSVVDYLSGRKNCKNEKNVLCITEQQKVIEYRGIRFLDSVKSAFNRCKFIKIRQFLLLFIAYIFHIPDG